jgi:hypothetical protein
MTGSGERGKGQIMLSEEWLRAIQEDRRREFEAAQRARAVRSNAPRRGRLRTWLGDHLTDRPASVRGGAHTGTAATDLSA